MSPALCLMPDLPDARHEPQQLLLSREAFPTLRREIPAAAWRLCGRAAPRRPPPLPRIKKRLPLPPVASRVISAGAPSPRVLSPWRVRALRFLAAVRERGTFTVTDVKAHKISASWVERWGVAVDWTTEVRRGKTVRVRVYRLTTNPEKLPDWGYKDVAAELAAADAAGKGAA